MFDSAMPERPEQMRPVDPQQILTAQLAAVVWLEVLAGIRKLPWEIANPILQTLTAQFTRQTEPPPPPVSPPEETAHAPD